MYMWCTIRVHCYIRQQHQCTHKELPASPTYLYPILCSYVHTDHSPYDLASSPGTPFQCCPQTLQIFQCCTKTLKKLEYLGTRLPMICVYIHDYRVRNIIQVCWSLQFLVCTLGLLTNNAIINWRPWVPNMETVGLQCAKEIIKGWAFRSN